MENHLKNIVLCNDADPVFSRSIALYEATCAKINMMGKYNERKHDDKNGSKEEYNLEKSMGFCISTKAVQENTKSKNERNYEESMESNTNTLIEDSAAFQEHCDDEPVELVEVTSERKGAKILFASDDCYGVAENLLKDDDPLCNTHTIFDNKTNNNVDGWKTRKTRNKMQNFVIIQLAAKTNIHSIYIDTACFTDISQFSIQGGQLSKNLIEKTYLQNRKNKLGGSSTVREYTYMQNQTQKWNYLIRTQDLSPGYPSIRKKIFKISPHNKITHLRLNIFPDGGIARLRAYGEVVLNTKLTMKEINLISSLNYTQVVAFGELYIGHPSNIIQPNKATSIVDGWETARKENYNYECNKILFNKIPGGNWASFKLGRSGVVTRVVIDTSFFAGNAPYMVRVQGFYRGYELNRWKNIIPDVCIKPGTEQSFNVEENNRFSVTNVKISLKPDGGISRFRVFGVPNVI